MRKTLICTMVTLCLATGLPAGAAQSPGDGEPREGTGITVTHPALRTWAETGETGRRAWIFFRDRGSASGQLVPLTPQAEARRLRLGVSLETAERQPVAPEYIEAVRRQGGRIHRISRWLNAVSVDFQEETIERLAQETYVASIRPVVRYTRTPLESTSFEATEFAPLGVTPAALDYGGSLAQIQQINAHLAHDRGFTGDGVIVAMFDTGFRKDHVAFADALAGGRLIAEWDFVFDDGDVQNEPEDNPSSHNHGTSTWSVLGGAYPGQLYGPAYGASFLLAKTEDIRSETQVEEDNWMAAVEWSDSLGAGVISSSLTYSDWYTTSDYDGLTAVTTIAANMATAVGIVICNSAGNAGPAPQTIGAPVDAFGILSVGSVTSTGSISSFSSRGPTADGRIKPEVCARGSSTWLASASGTTTVGAGSGTSFSCPLVGGCVALLIEAQPTWNPLMVREALMQTASRATIPDNTFGWGIIDVNAALDYVGSVEVQTASYSDTIFTYDPELTVAALATAASAVDAQASSLYVSVDGGAFVAQPVSEVAPDTLAGAIASPPEFMSQIEYYLQVEDTVGFAGRAPQTPGTVYSFVWQTWLPGDTDKNEVINSADILLLVDFVFKSGAPFDPAELAEVNGVPGIDAADVVYLVNHTFKSGPPPVWP